ncbi:M48 family metalloprotease [Urbifossiella limnaea]|uniref:Uncharacterized protein n=1 Tax=Urbifossiella limnaea TaxID=2528023 RepID=A0A517Y0M3_9BACT|nr:hypothetical protein [Urbifossiella limnaea]QDU23310.1 hypothetical protein ETAA1_53050 [Urbifossiella limnaea]
MGLYEDYVDLLALHNVDPPEKVTHVDLLKGLEQMAASSDPTQRAIGAKAVEVHNKYGSQVDEFVRRHGKYSASGMLDTYVTFINDVLHREGRTLRDDIFIDEFPTGEFNACAVRTNNGHLCLLNTGLLKLLYHLSLSSCYLIKGNVLNQTLDFSARLALEDEASLPAIGAAIKSIYAYLAFGQHPYPIEIQEGMHEAALLYANGIAGGMRTFVVGHELAHVTLGHLDTSEKRSVIAENGRLEVASSSQEQEYEADLESQRLMLKITGPGMSFAFGGVCFLTCGLIVESFQSKLFGSTVDSQRHRATHPPTHLRLMQLWQALEQQVSKDELAATATIARLLFDLLSILDATSIEHTTNGIKIHFNKAAIGQSSELRRSPDAPPAT